MSQSGGHNEKMVVTDMCDGKTRCGCWSTFQKYYDGIYIKSLCNITSDYVKGMWYGIQEFLANHPEWYIKDRFFNNNGLMVLARR
jgi:hypothetical protein